MKKLSFALLLFAGITSASAQKSNVVSAYNYLKYEEIDKAKQAIDEAAKNPQTEGMAKTWYYKGLVYEKIYKNAKPEYAVLDADPLSKAIDDYNKSLELDPKSEYVEDIVKRKNNIYYLIFNQGIEDFKANKFDNAMKSFEGALKIVPNDTVSTLNAASAADRANNTEKAKKYYQKLIDFNYKDAKIYSALAMIHKEGKDTAKALEVLAAGIAKYPNDQALILTQLNIFIEQGKDQEALGNLEKAIALDPKKAVLHYNYGLITEKTGNLTKAEEAYKKAIEIQPDFFDAIYSIGAMYFNKAAGMANAALNIKNQKEYDKAKAESDAVFAKALPYLEKAYSINPKDIGTLQSLRQLYVRMNQMEKSKKIKAELDELTK